MRTGLQLFVAALGATLLTGCGKSPAQDNVVDPPPVVTDPAPISAPDRGAPAPAETASAADPRRAEVIKALIQNVGTLDDRARTVIGYADIGGDEREEALVYLVDPNRCGSGGCSLIVLTPSGKGWRTIGQTSVTRLPVHRLLTKKDGWNDLAVGVGGGGLPAGTALLRFDNRRYPDNPSTQPILNRLPEGARLVIADDDAALEPVP